MPETTTPLSLLTFSLSSFGLIAFIYKLSKYIRVKNATKTYFKDKTVLITGASSGLGKGISIYFNLKVRIIKSTVSINQALAEEFYPLGAQLILCARNNEELSNVKKNLMKVHCFELSDFILLKQTNN